MGKVIEKLAGFATKAQFGDLPDYVVHEMKRVILDSIGCAIGGLSTERGKVAAELARRLGGPSESTIIGTNDKVSCANAAFANGESMNALDFDALSAAAIHDVPTLIPAALALAESVGISGKNLILAIALGFEISGRLKSAGARVSPITEGPERGKLRWPPVLGYSVVTLAAAAGAGKILNLDRMKMANAIGIAGCLCPPSIFRKWLDTAPIRMIKYGSTGWGAQVGVISALLAEMGYTGDTDLFEGEYGFWRYTGREKGETGEVLADLGTKWQGYQMRYKQYPCCGHLAGVVGEFIQLVDENGLGPEDVERIVVYLDSIGQFKVFRENTLRTPDDYYFSAPYLLACATCRINPAHWHDPEVKQDQRIRKFIQRVEFSIIVDERDSGLARLETPKMRVEVVARGRTFKEKEPCVKGLQEPEEFRNTDQELIKKFTDNASRVLPLSKANEAAQTLLELEKLQNTAQLIELVAP